MSITPVSPYGHANLNAAWEADSLSLSDGDSVVTWTDGENSIVATAPTVGTRPVYQTNIIGAMPGVYFDGTRRLQTDAATFATAQNRTIIVVAQVANLSNTQNETPFALWNASGARTSYVVRSSSTGGRLTYWDNANVWKDSGHTVPHSEPTILSWTVKGGSNAIGSGSTFITRDLADRAAHVAMSYAVPAHSRGVIGDSQIGGGNAFFKGHIFAILCFNAALPRSTREGFEAWLSAKWGVKTARYTYTPSGTPSQFYENFEHSTVGELPSDWTPRWDTVSQCTAVSDVLASNGKALRLSHANNTAQHAVSPDEVGSPGDFQFRASWVPRRVSGSAQKSGFVVRGSGASGSDRTGWIIYSDSENNFRAANRVANTLIESECLYPFPHTWDEYLVLKGVVHGDLLRVKLYRPDESEPTDDLMVLDTSGFTDGGWLGFYGHRINTSGTLSTSLDWIGVGVNGAAIPDDFVDGAVAPTVSIDQTDPVTLEVLGTIQLTATATGTPEPTLTWSSDDPSVASVDPDTGLVTAGADAGSATITVEAENDEGSAFDSIEVIVLDVPGWALDWKPLWDDQRGRWNVKSELPALFPVDRPGIVLTGLVHDPSFLAHIPTGPAKQFRVRATVLLGGRGSWVGGQKHLSQRSLTAGVAVSGSGIGRSPTKSHFLSSSPPAPIGEWDWWGFFAGIRGGGPLVIDWRTGLPRGSWDGTGGGKLVVGFLDYTNTSLAHKPSGTGYAGPTIVSLNLPEGVVYSFNSDLDSGLGGIHEQPVRIDFCVRQETPTHVMLLAKVIDTPNMPAPSLYDAVTDESWHIRQTFGPITLRCGWAGLWGRSTYDLTSFCKQWALFTDFEAEVLENGGCEDVLIPPPPPPEEVDLEPALPLVKAWAFTFDGHVFYVLSTVAGRTLICDLTTGQWHTWKTGESPFWNMYRGIMWGGRPIAADETSNEIWMVDPSSELDEGEHEIARTVTGYQPVRGTHSRRQGSMRLTARRGVMGGEDLVVRMRFSDDAGSSWSPYYDIDLDPDSYSTRMEWRSLGRLRAPGRIWEITDEGGLVRIDGADFEGDT
jgi:hypothetical protein